MTHSFTQMITMPEGKTLEFKRDLSSPKNMLKTLVSFANTAGGRLLIGVEDRTKEVLGVENPLDEEERLCNLIADNIEPLLVPNVEMIAFKDKTLLGVEVYPSGSRPHWLKSEGATEGVYVRLGSTNRKADRELIAELKRSAEGIAFDEMPLPELSADSLDIAMAKALFKDQRELSEKELLTLKLLKQVQGRLVPTIGGMLLFGIEREEHFSDAWIQCGRFAGTTKSIIFDHIEIHEHLPIAVERVIEFIKKHAMRGADFSQIRLREQMLNHGLDKPLIGTDTGYFQVTFPGPGDNIERLRVPEQLMQVTPAVESQLNERQRKMMQWLVEGKELTSRQCEMEFDVTRPVISGDFRKLVEMGLADKLGAGRSTRYCLKGPV